MENNERKFTGAWIPRELYLNTELTWTEKILLIEIDFKDSSEKGCFASNKFLGEFVGIKESSMANMISKLKSMGYLEQVFFDGRNRGLRVNLELKSCLKKKKEPSHISESRVNLEIIEPSHISEHNNNSNNSREKRGIALKDFDFSKELTNSSLSYKKNINRIGAVYRHLKDEDPNNITLVDHELLSDWMYAAEKLEAIDDKSFSRMFAFAKRHKFWGDKITGLPFLAKNWDKILIDYRKEG
jgi:hypothetical protein